MIINPNERQSHGVRRETSEGFTLVELLVVVTIIVVLASLMGPTLTSALRGTNLTQAADKVIGVLSAARQTATTKNQTVEVRFYAYVDPETPGDTGQVHAIQPFSIDDSGTNAIPLMKAQVLPSTVVITTNSVLSPLLSPVNLKNFSGSVPKIPRVGTGYTCFSFRYYRSGMTDLVPKTTPAGDNNWFVTVINAKDDRGSTCPANYTTVRVDTLNGSLKIYRPTL